MDQIGVRDGSFRNAGERLGAKINAPGLRFFDSSPQKISFGPGAGLVLGVSIGAASLRAVLVDANGWRYHEHESVPVQDQLALPPSELLDRIREAAGAVLLSALRNEDLLVAGRLPFLAISVAWGIPLDRRKVPVGHALSDDLWHNGEALDERVAGHLGLPSGRSHALNDTHAAAIAVAFAETRRARHVFQRFPRLAIVMRLAGGVGGAIIGIEPPEEHQLLGKTSGFAESILIGGGDLGHMPLSRAAIDARNASLVLGLGPLVAQRCSCTGPSQPVPDHLEAYASTAALAHRITPDEAVCGVIHRVVADPDNEVHGAALRDVGELVAHALLGPVAMLNPASITLTGSLAVPVVEKTLTRCVHDAQVLGRKPEIGLFESNGEARDSNDKFTRAHGAALVVLRRHVHRRIAHLVEGRKEGVVQQVAALTSPLAELPWNN